MYLQQIDHPGSQTQSGCRTSCSSVQASRDHSVTVARYDLRLVQVRLTD
jgi:hypothetical protein